MNNVFSIFADTFNVTNNNLTLTNNAGIPLTNLTGIYSGALNSESWQPIPAPIDTPGESLPSSHCSAYKGKD